MNTGERQSVASRLEARGHEPPKVAWRWIQRLSPVLGHSLFLVAALSLAAVLVVGTPPWTLSRGNKLALGIVALQYWLALGGAFAAVRLGASPPVLPSVAASSTMLAVASVAALLHPSERYSELLLVAAALSVPIGVIGRHVVQSRRFRSPARVAAGAAAATVLVVAMSRSLVGEGAVAVKERHLSANQQFLTVQTFPGLLPAAEVATARGGSITRDPGTEGYLLVTAVGNIRRVLWGEHGEPEVTAVLAQVPINFLEFAADNEEKVPKVFFRVADLVARLEPDGATRIFVSHHHWDRAKRCFVVRVSTTTFSERGAAAPQPSEWRTLFETSPCLQIFESRGVSFAGLQIGGNLELLDDSTLLLTVGDHQFDGWYHEPNLVRDPNAHYGKTVTIDIRSGASSIFTVGHRNPQGLLVTNDGKIWSTEQGPQGGDELNLLRRGGDYGYPEHTYGTEYGSVVWPPSAGKSQGDMTIRPVYAWVPSIGISELVLVSDAAFPRWQGDLLVASLGAGRLWRVRIEEARAVYAEPIEIGERIRDIAAGSGEFVLWTDSGAIVRVRPDTSVSDGSALFARYCGSCHDDTEHRIGPNLIGVLDRPIASAPDYSYSDSLQGLRGAWDRERLDQFVAAPTKLVPGTTMAFDGVPDDEIRSRILEYIEAFY